MNLCRNKKGNVFDVIYIMMILFLFITLTLIAVKIYNEWEESSQGKLTSPTSDIVLQKASMTLDTLDIVFAFVVGMMFILVFISAFMIDTHPAFFVVTLILLIIALILAVVFSNIYETISTGALTEEAERYTVSNYLMSNLPFIILIAIIASSIVLYAKFKYG